MQWFGLGGCLILAAGCVVRFRELIGQNRRNEARLTLAALVYIGLFVGYFAANFGNRTLASALANPLPVELGISFLILFHVALLVHSTQHPPFEMKVKWSEGRRAFLRQTLLLAEFGLMCFYCCLGLMVRDASMFISCENGNYAQVQRCLALGAGAAGGRSAGVLDDSTDNFLEAALNHHNFRIAKLLMDRGAPLDLPDQSTKMTPLMVESAQDNPEAVQFLIDSGAYVNQTTGDGQTALKCAARYTDVARIILKQPVFVNACSRDGSSALILFARAGNAQGTKLLIQKGAFVQIVTRYGFTPLMAAAKSGNLPTVMALISAGANCSRRDDDGRDALYFAMAGHHRDIGLAIERKLHYTVHEALRAEAARSN